MIDVFHGSENDGPYIEHFDTEEEAARFRLTHRDTILVNGQPAVVDDDGNVVESPEEAPTPEQATEEAASSEAKPATIEDSEADDGADGPGQPDPAGRHAADPAGVGSQSVDATTENVATDNATSRSTGQ